MKIGSSWVMIYERWICIIKFMLIHMMCHHLYTILQYTCHFRFIYPVDAIVSFDNISKRNTWKENPLSSGSPISLNYALWKIWCVKWNSLWAKCIEKICGGIFNIKSFKAQFIVWKIKKKKFLKISFRTFFFYSFAPLLIALYTPSQITKWPAIFNLCVCC